MKSLTSVLLVTDTLEIVNVKQSSYNALHSGLHACKYDCLDRIRHWIQIVSHLNSLVYTRSCWMV